MRDWKTIVLHAFLTMILCSCAVDARFLNQKGYDSIALGTEITLVEELYGPPYEVISLPDGNWDYVFIERIPSGDGRTDQVNYILRVSHGRVVGKRSENIGQAFYVDWMQ